MTTKKRKDTSVEDRIDQAYIDGKRLSLSYLLGHIVGELGYDRELTAEERVARLVSEREQIVAKLRDLCADFGDNDWPNSLHLGDVIEKHLAPYLDELKGRR